MSEHDPDDSPELLGRHLEKTKRGGVTRMVPMHPNDIRAALEAKDAEIERLRADRDSWAQQASDRAQDALDLVAAERERCAKVCEDSNTFDYDDPGGFFAELIRKPVD
jgi:hypothetical protein